MTVDRDKWGKNHEDILDELLREQGITKYVVANLNDEGGQLPTKLETRSWSVLLPDERILALSLKWDPKRIAPDGSKGYYRLKNWGEELLSDERKVESIDGSIVRTRVPGGWRKKYPEYIYASKKLGLPLIEE